MTRTLCRLLAVTGVLAGAAAVGTAQTANLREFKKEAKPPADPTGRMAQLREGKLRVGGQDLKANQELFRAVARYHVYKATDDKYYLPQDGGDLRPRETAGTFDQVLIDVGNQLLQPGPAGDRYSTAQKEYIAEFGAALNEAVREVLAPNPPAPIRVNAGRLLALAARSGAPALAPTIHQLLTNSFPFAKKADRTPPELLLYAVKAAGNLFAAYDPVWHLNPDAVTQFRHSFEVKDQVALARDLIALLEKGPGVADLAAPADLDKPAVRPVRPDGSPADAPPGGDGARLEAAPAAERDAVTRYFRRQVAAAVCRIRPDLLEVPGEPNSRVRPGVAIARIAVGDAALDPPVTTPELAEAVIGLCYLAPSPTLNVPEALAAAAAAARDLVRDYTIRQSNPAVGRHAKLIPWKGYTDRLTAALDHLTAQANRNPRWREHRAAVAQLVGVLKEDLVTPLRRDEVTSAPSTVRLDEIVKARQGQDKAARSLYTDDPSFVLVPRPAGQ